MTMPAVPSDVPVVCPMRDARLALAIEGQLGRGADARHVGIVVWEGAVTLLGRVETEAARERLFAAIAAMPGVKTVRDRLTVRSN